MAVTKIKAIKSTLNKAMEYICNPRKTKDGLIVDFFWMCAGNGCGRNAHHRE